jgi:hypothetical protein
MPSLISHLSEPAQVNLLDDLNYLNMAEIKSFSVKHSIPFSKRNSRQSTTAELPKHTEPVRTALTPMRFQDPSMHRSGAD